MTIHDIKEMRATKIAEMRSINEAAAAASRDLTDDERQRFDGLDGEVRNLNTRLNDAERLAEYERLESRADPISGGTFRQGDLSGYSLAKALVESRAGTLTGVEAEAHQELAKDRAEVRGVMVPTDVILGGEKRTLLTSGSGGNMVSTDLAAMTDRRRPVLMVEAMGATILRGLTGNIDLPRLATSGTAGWVAEDAAATRSDATFAKKSMAPRRSPPNMKSRVGCCCNPTRPWSRSCAQIWGICLPKLWMAQRSRVGVLTNQPAFLPMAA